jgi:hypothetical protein
MEHRTICTPSITNGRAWLIHACVKLCERMCVLVCRYGLGQTYELLHMYFHALYYYRKAATLRYIY